MATQASLILNAARTIEIPARRRGRPAKTRPDVTGLVSRRVLGERLSTASAAAWFGVPGAHLRQPTRGVARIAAARQAAIYFAHVVFCANLTRAGGIVGRDRTTARHACMCMEDRRDDARFDRACGVLEPAMRLWIERFEEAQQDGASA
jgi:hypothetical protein